MDGPWVFINWLYPGRNKFTAIKDVRQIEAQIKEEGLRGWYATSEKEHKTMHKILSKMGASMFREDEHNLHFLKEVV